MKAAMRPLLVLLSSLFTLSACGIEDSFALKARVDSVCQRVDGQKFMLPPGGEKLGMVHLVRSFEFDVAKEGALSQLGADVRLSKVTLFAAENTLDFIDEAEIRLHAPEGSTMPNVPLFAIRPELGATSVSFEGDQLELTQYLEGGVLKYDVELTGTAPKEPVTLAVEACASAQLTLALP